MKLSCRSTAWFVPGPSCDTFLVRRVQGGCHVALKSEQACHVIASQKLLTLNGGRRRLSLRSFCALPARLPGVTSTHVGCDTIQCGACAGIWHLQLLGSRENPGIPAPGQIGDVTVTDTDSRRRRRVRQTRAVLVFAITQAAP